MCFLLLTVYRVSATIQVVSLHPKGVCLNDKRVMVATRSSAKVYNMDKDVSSGTSHPAPMTPQVISHSKSVTAILLLCKFMGSAELFDIQGHMLLAIPK
jgi:hypothetical protein